MVFYSISKGKVIMSYLGGIMLGDMGQVQHDSAYKGDLEQ